MNTQIKTLWIKRKFLKEILDGRKTVEVRVGYRNIQELKPGMAKDEILRVLRNLYPPFKEKLGVFAIELESH